MHILNRFAAAPAMVAAFAVPAFAQEHSAGPVNLLKPEAGLIIWTVGIFLVFLFVLWRWFFPVILASVESREKSLREALASAKQDRDEAAKLLAEQRASLEAARTEAQKFIADGRAVAEKMRATMLEETKKQQDELLARAKRDIEGEKVKAIADLRSEAIDLALKGASRVIEKNLDDATNRKLVEDFLKTVGENLMRDATIARNYAQALLALANKADGVDTFGGFMSGLAESVRENPVLRHFLAAPQVSEDQKRSVFRKALDGKAPRTFVLFIEKLVSNRRQMLIPDIAIEYVNLVDEQAGRVHATVTVARAPKEGEAEELSKRLSEALGKSVVAHLTVNPAILGGLIVRVGDSVMDGSVKRRLGALRQALVTGSR